MKERFRSTTTTNKFKRCAKFESKFEWHFKKHVRVNKLSIDWRRVEKFRGYWTKRTELKISRTNIFLSNLLEEINKAKIGITLNNLRRFSLLRITSKVNRRGVLFIIESGMEGACSRQIIIDLGFQISFLQTWFP